MVGHMRGAGDPMVEPVAISRNEQYLYPLITIRLSVVVRGIHLCGGVEAIPVLLCIQYSFHAPLHRCIPHTTTLSLIVINVINA
jgi:hypothetical protein